MTDNKNFYITTTLPYVNAEPHIGFALEIIQADVIARYHKSLGKNIVFNTGTDEHGQKIYNKAQEVGQDVQEYCDTYAAKFELLQNALNLSYTDFIRTTDPDHKKAAQEFWQLCDKNGDIYKKMYKVKYCVGCELEKTDSELVEGKCQEHPNMTIEEREEENYFFKFSNYQEKLLKLYSDNPEFVLPKEKLNEIKVFVDNGLKDFSISRLKAKMPHGVPVPGDPEHVMYVWFDALINYISTLGWPKNTKKFKQFWPGVQTAGKDNLRQQSAMWQAMLMSAGLPVSEKVLIHGFIFSNGQKISKSLGNSVNPIELAEQYGTDALRYFLLKEIPTFKDSDFTLKRFEEVYNADLANGLGNLVSRVAAMINKNFKGEIPKTTEELEKIDITGYLENYKLDLAMKQLWKHLAKADKYIEQTKPWEIKDDEEKLKNILGKLALDLIEVNKNLKIFLPETAEKIDKIFAGNKVGKFEPLFPRLKK